MSKKRNFKKNKKNKKTNKKANNVSLDVLFLCKKRILLKDFLKKWNIQTNTKIQLYIWKRLTQIKTVGNLM